MSLDRSRVLIPYGKSARQAGSGLAMSFAGVALSMFALVADLDGQDAVGTAAGAAQSYQVVPQTGANATTPPLNPAVDSNLHTGSVPENEVASEPRRFHYGFQITTRGVYDDNINISQSGRVSDYYFTIEPVLTLGLGDIVGHQDNYIRLDYAP